MLSPSLYALATVNPPHQADLSRTLEVGRAWLVDDPESYERFARFLRNAKVDQRFFSLPPEALLAARTQEERAALFVEHGYPLAFRAAQSALQRSEIPPQELGGLVFTSCTVPLIPSLDARLVFDLGISPLAVRVPIFQQGCAGGVAGLSLASRLVPSTGPVLLVSLELCSLLFYTEDRTPSQLVGSAIFADGAAAAVLRPADSGMVIRGAQSQLLPESAELMGYDIRSDGPHLRLMRELPGRVAEHVGDTVTHFLAAQELTPQEVNWWLFHPGGDKILNSLEQIFAVKPEQASWSRTVLSQFGNMSSASVLFVAEQFLNSGCAKPGDKVLMLGIGPGVTLEQILFEIG